jgi:hypothetical protein
MADNSYIWGLHKYKTIENVTLGEQLGLEDPLCQGANYWLAYLNLGY